MAKKPVVDVTESMSRHSDWYGFRWTDSGKFLVGPHGDRMTAQRLKGLLWRDSMELYRKGFSSRKAAEANKSRTQKVKVVIVDLGDYRDKHFGKAAS